MKPLLYITLLGLALRANAQQNYLQGHDLDGDGTSDKISFYYSGGAHCCYTIQITLSSDGVVRDFPFTMDGGYVMGVDGSQPDHFNIKDHDGDSLPEVFMEIATYNGEKYPVEASWAMHYRIFTNEILFDYKNDSLHVVDVGEKLKY